MDFNEQIVVQQWPQPNHHTALQIYFISFNSLVTLNVTWTLQAPSLLLPTLSLHQTQNSNIRNQGPWATHTRNKSEAKWYFQKFYSALCWSAIVCKIRENQIQILKRHSLEWTGMRRDVNRRLAGQQSSRTKIWSDSKWMKVEEHLSGELQWRVGIK